MCRYGLAQQTFRVAGQASISTACEMLRILLCFRLPLYHSPLSPATFVRVTFFVALLAQNEMFFTLSAHFPLRIVEPALATRVASLLKTAKKTSASTP
jgi:hypothetical protein